MALDIGSRLGHYDVTALIGEGDGTGLKPLCRVLPDAAADLNPGSFYLAPSSYGRLRR